MSTRHGLIRCELAVIAVPIFVPCIYIYINYIYKLYIYTSMCAYDIICIYIYILE